MRSQSTVAQAISLLLTIIMLVGATVSHARASDHDMSCCFDETVMDLSSDSCIDCGSGGNDCATSCITMAVVVESSIALQRNPLQITYYTQRYRTFYPLTEVKPPIR